jgi:hypothetical protein
VSAARGARAGVIELRYEDLTQAPDQAALTLARELDVRVDGLADALSGAHRLSVGRYRDSLTADELADVVAEAGDLLRELGYMSD